MESAISYALFCLEISEGEAFPLVLPCWVTEEESWGQAKSGQCRDRVRCSGSECAEWLGIRLPDRQARPLFACDWCSGR